MPEQRRYNQRTGQYEWVDTQTGQARPAGPNEALAAATTPTPSPQAQSPSIAQAAAGGQQGLTPETMRNASIRPEDIGRVILPFMLFGEVGERANASGTSVPTASATPPAPPPAIDFGSPTDLSPADQAYIDTLTQLAGTAGTASPPPALRELPAPPEAQVDPALAFLETQARQRNSQVQGVLGDMRSEMEAQNPRNQNKWQRLAQWMGNLAADGNLANAGAIMSQMLRDDQAMAHELRMETLRLTLEGFGYEDAVTEASARLMSGTHQTEEANRQNAWQTQVGNIERQDTQDMRAWEVGQRNRDSQTRMASIIAEAMREAQDRSETRWRENVQPFLAVPEYSQQAGEALANSSGMDPNAARILGEEQVVQAAAQGLLVTLSGADLSDSNVQDQVAGYLQQWNPSITPDVVENYAGNPQALYLMAIQGPNARQAFLANRDLARTGRLGSLVGGE